MSVRALAIGLLLAGATSARAFDVLIEPYRAAAAAGAVGSVTGRAYEERRRPEGAEQPLNGAALVLLPRSAELLQKLEAVKRTARDSATAYRASAPAILKLRESWEKALWEAGAADLVRATAVDVEGRFSVEELPAGAWVLIATHSIRFDKRGAEAKSKQRGVFAPGTRLTGYAVVTVWLREVTVASGRSEAVELMGRNAWFSGVVEERAPDAGR